MIDFDVYTFQFRPVADCYQPSLFDSIEERRKAMENKNATFEKIFKDINLYYRGSQLLNREIFFQDDVFVFKLAIRKQIKLEKNFNTRVETNEPSVCIIIYNDKEIQRIAIEQNPAAFSNTEVVAKILRKAYSNLLFENGLDITIHKEYQENEFWNIIQDCNSAIQMVRFEFEYPNLPRVSDAINKVIRNASEQTCSNKTRLEFNASSDGVLNVDESNPALKSLNKASSNTGVPITIKAKGVNKFIKTGKTTKEIQIQELEITADNVEQIKELLKN